MGVTSLAMRLTDVCDGPESVWSGREIETYARDRLVPKVIVDVCTSSEDCLLCAPLKLPGLKYFLPTDVNRSALLAVL